MIDSESRSQVRPLESFKRSRFELLAIASFIISYPSGKKSARASLRRRLGHSGTPRCPGGIR